MFAAEVAVAVDADDPQVGRVVRVRQELERVGLELRRRTRGSSSSGIGDGFRSSFWKAIVLRARRVAVLVALVAHPVRRGGPADPQADLERPVAELVGVLLPLQLQGADQRRGAAELVERQQPQRVAHQHAQPGRGDAGIAQPAEDQREGGQAEVRLGLAAAGREEQQVDDLAVVVRGSAMPGGSSGGTRAGTAARSARCVCRVLALHDARSAAGRRRPSLVGDPEGFEAPADRSRRSMPSSIRSAAIFGPLEQLLGGLVALRRVTSAASSAGRRSSRGTA